MSEITRTIRPKELWLCDVTRNRHKRERGDIDRCECAGREYKCTGCEQWKPWCNGGAPDVRCDECVSAELVLTDTLVEIETRAADIAAHIESGDVDAVTRMTESETLGWDRHIMNQAPEIDLDVANSCDRELLAGWLSREIYMADVE